MICLLQLTRQTQWPVLMDMTIGKYQSM